LENKIFDNDIDYDRILHNCRIGNAKQRLIYQGTSSSDQLWGFPVVYSRSFTPMLFDPWSGYWIEESYVSCYYSAFANSWKNRSQQIYTKHANMNTWHLGDLPEKDWLFKIFEEDRKLHSKERFCTSLESSTRYGERCDTSLIEIPNIRVVAVLNKRKYGGWTSKQFELFSQRNGYQGLEKWEFSGWTALNFCPFCGASLPERLDKKIIEVLRDEYSLTSWKDYKKAPHEFHTDEWWRKRGL
jgi:hypothetical protein